MAVLRSKLTIAATVQGIRWTTLGVGKALAGSLDRMGVQAWTGRCSDTVERDA